MNPNPPELVTQADREAAAEYLELVAPKFPNLAEEVRTKQTALVRAFARHRLRHTPDREAIARAAYEISSAMDVEQGFDALPQWDEAPNLHRNGMLRVADAIIAMIEGGGAHG